MEEWRYVFIMPGAQYVMTVGTTEMLELFVNSLDTMEVRFLLTHCRYPSFPYYCTFSHLASVALANHQVLSNDSLFYYLDDIQCTGNENMLSDCRHGGVGIHNCLERAKEAGVICSSKFT